MGIGIMCGLCFDILFDRLDMEPPTNSERLFWFIAWPFFLVIFLWGIYNDDE
jgi:hypothetical protein